MSTEKHLAATLFPLEGLTGQTFRLRRLRIADSIPRDDNTPVRLQRWASQLWHEAKLPVTPSEQNGSLGFLVPDDPSITPGRVFTVLEVPDMEFRIEVTDQVLDIAPESATNTQRWIAAEMLKRCITDKFVKMTNKYWRFRWNCFFRLLPENCDNDRDLVNAFRGMRFAVAFRGCKQPCLAADVLTKFLGRKSLVEYSPDERVEVLRWHLDATPLDKRAWFMRDNGTMKRSCQYASDANATAGSYRLQGLDQTVVEYYQSKYSLDLKDSDPLVYVRDHGGSDSWPVPTCRLFPIFTTEDEEMSTCSVQPQLSPQERVELIRGFMADVGKLQFAGRDFRISHSFLSEERSVFPAPALEYREGRMLTPEALREKHQDDDTVYQAYRNAKVTWLYEQGTFGTQPLPGVVLLYPKHLPRQTREALVNRINAELGGFLRTRLNVIRERYYEVWRGSAAAEGLLREAEKLSEWDTGAIMTLVVLADSFNSDVHRRLKTALGEVPSQCLLERTAKRIANDSAGVGVSSRLRNLVLAILTEAGVQPWVLGEEFHHDFHAGVDVLDGLVNYTFVFGRGGRLSHTDFGERVRRRGSREKVERVELREKLETGIRTAHAEGVPLRSIVIHRDGRWWDSENQGLTEAIRNLTRQRILAENCRVAVLEIRKSSLPIRLFTERSNGGRVSLENPMPGSYLVLDDETTILTTTGRPGVWDRQHRTASALVLRLARQDERQPFDIKELAHDVYRLTHLNWNAPEIEISLPVTIRWSDNHLRQEVVAAPADSDAVDEDALVAAED